MLAIALPSYTGAIDLGKLLNGMSNNSNNNNNNNNNISIAISSYKSIAINNFLKLIPT